MMNGGDPTVPLESLRAKTGWSLLANHLLLLDAISRTRFIKVRNLLTGEQNSLRSPEAITLIDIYLRQLLINREYREIEVIELILADIYIHPPSLENVRAERLFAFGLEALEAGRLENALGFFTSITTATPSILHNIALIHQKMGRYADANERWINILKSQKKPKKPTHRKYIKSTRVCLSTLRRILVVI